MNRPRIALLILLATFACAAEGREDDDAELTQSQRDSILAESRIPGAGAVGRARDTEAAMRERAARMDSLQEP